MASPDRPVLIHQADCATASVRANTSVPVPFQFELFSGQVLIYIAGLPSTPASLFKHQRRRTHLVIQVSHKVKVQQRLRHLCHTPAVSPACRVCAEQDAFRGTSGSLCRSLMCSPGKPSSDPSATCPTRGSCKRYATSRAACPPALASASAASSPPWRLRHRYLLLPNTAAHTVFRTRGSHVSASHFSESPQQYSRSLMLCRQFMLRPPAVNLH